VWGSVGWCREEQFQAEVSGAMKKRSGLNETGERGSWTGRQNFGHPEKGDEAIDPHDHAHMHTLTGGGGGLLGLPLLKRQGPVRPVVAVIVPPPPAAPPTKPRAAPPATSVAVRRALHLIEQLLPVRPSVRPSRVMRR